MSGAARPEDGYALGHRSKRLSADLPQHWLTAMPYWLLSDSAWRLYTGSLMWSIGRTDGYIPAKILSVLMPGSEQERAKAAAELIEAGLWAKCSGGWTLPDWTAHQSTVAQIEQHRAEWRTKKRKQRARRATESNDVPGGTPPSDTKEDSNGGRPEEQIGGDYGTERQGTKRQEHTAAG